MDKNFLMQTGKWNLKLKNIKHLKEFEDFK